VEVIPAIDLLSGAAVRLRQGRYDAVTQYPTAPEDIAASWSSIAQHLHVVDLEGAREGRPVQTGAIERIVASFGRGVQAGGGIRSFEAVRAYLDLGIERVVLGTAAIRDPDLVRRSAEAYPHRVIVAVDARDGFVATDGWLGATGHRAADVVRAVSALPIAGILYTDIQRDGMETGPNVVETARLADETNAPIIASGGVGALDHLRDLARASSGIVAAIVGRALHEERFTLEAAVRAARGEPPAGQAGKLPAS
jgi:phosphoribosylformimino-5-aminoimidazole carboxamide ribotide isomerase